MADSIFKLKQGGTGVQTAAALTGILDNVVGDSGAGGTKGLVPAPASGDAAANKFLKADGSWTVVDAGVSDGDKGDITVSSSGAVWTIDNEAVTLAKIANASASSKLLGSGASGSGAAYAELTLGTNLSMSGTTLNAAGGGGAIAANVIPTGLVNDSNVTFVLPTIPSGDILLYASGVRLLPTADYSITGDTITMVTAPATGTIIFADYDIGSGVAGDLVAANNLDDLDNVSTARTNLGLAIGSDVQAYDADTAKLDVAQVFTKAQGTTPVALTSTSNAVAVDASLSNKFTHVLTENTTVSSPSNLVDGKSYTFVFKQHASAVKTLAFNATFKFIDDANSTIPAAVDSLLVVSADYTTVGGLICATAIITV